MNSLKPTYAIEKALSFFREDDWSQRFLLGSGGVSLNLTGCTIECTVAQGTTSVEVDIDTSELGIGAFTLSIPRTITIDMLGQYNYEVKIIDSLDTKLTRVYGTIVVHPDVR